MFARPASLCGLWCARPRCWPSAAAHYCIAVVAHADLDRQHGPGSRLVVRRAVVRKEGLAQVAASLARWVGDALDGLPPAGLAAAGIAGDACNQQFGLKARGGCKHAMSLLLHMRKVVAPPVGTCRNASTCPRCPCCLFCAAMIQQPRVPPTGQRQAIEVHIKWREVLDYKRELLRMLSIGTGLPVDKLDFVSREKTLGSPGREGGRRGENEFLRAHAARGRFAVGRPRRWGVGPHALNPSNHG